MQYFSTNKKSPSVSFKQAVMKGLAPDGGLFMPAHIPLLTPSTLKKFSGMKFHELALEIAAPFVEPDIARVDLERIVKDAYDFDSPAVQWNQNLFGLELFHGPTLAFKDFGARFMARVLGYFVRNSDSKLTILVATSGDTGSAVANGFYQVEGIDVVLLYPEGKISRTQECQMNTLGENISALAVQGTFDDCQRLVKAAFLDPELNRKLNLTSANSINVARLIPQSFYYFRAVAQIDSGLPVVFSVPSGNYGNLTSGIFAKRMGLNVKRFVACSNRNDVVPMYLNTGVFTPVPSVATISNAMDVGNPSNFARILELYNGKAGLIRKDIYGASFSDDETRNAISEAASMYGMILDPHGAVAYLGIRKYLAECTDPVDAVFLQTAHPSKFPEVVEPLIGKKIPIPARLQECLAKKGKSVRLSSSFADLKSFLMS